MTSLMPLMITQKKIHHVQLPETINMYGEEQENQTRQILHE